MTRKHFEAIASIVSQIRNDGERIDTAIRFAIYLDTQNVSFNRHRFLKACGARF